MKKVKTESPMSPNSIRSQGSSKVGWLRSLSSLHWSTGLFLPTCRTFPSAELDEVPASPFLQPAQVTLDASPALTAPAAYHHARRRQLRGPAPSYTLLHTGVRRGEAKVRRRLGDS